MIGYSIICIGAFIIVRGWFVKPKEVKRKPHIECTINLFLN